MIIFDFVQNEEIPLEKSILKAVSPKVLLLIFQPEQRPYYLFLIKKRRAL
jgi:hypothetical protein